jgi:hypothetical protein
MGEKDWLEGRDLSLQWCALELYAGTESESLMHDMWLTKRGEPLDIEASDEESFALVPRMYMVERVERPGTVLYIFCERPA